MKPCCQQAAREIFESIFRDMCQTRDENGDEVVYISPFKVTLLRKKYLQEDKE